MTSTGDCAGKVAYVKHSDHDGQADHEAQALTAPISAVDHCKQHLSRIAPRSHDP